VSVADGILEAVRSVIGTGAAVLHEPELGGQESRFVQDCLASTFVSTVGTYVPRFEQALVDYTGARHAVAVVNGTVALQVALTMAGVERGDEVLAPALTFVGTANAICHAGAVPHFVDSNETTLGVDADALRAHLRDVGRQDGGVLRNRVTGRRIAAIVPVHVYGHPVDMAKLEPVCAEFGVTIVEDAAESLGSFSGDRHTGTSGLVSVLSFNGNKIVTTGGGGALLTNDDELAKRAKHLTTTAKKAHPWRFEHDAVGWNYRLPNLNAALGCAQMERLPEFVAAKRRLAQRYARAFESMRGVQFLHEPPGSRSNYWLCSIRIVNARLEARDAVIASLNAAGVGARAAWTLMHRLPMYETQPRAPLPIAERLEREIVNLPSGYSVARASGGPP
jgi:perosamine synthetase